MSAAYGTPKNGPRGKAVRAHAHPWRGQEYFHTKFENGDWVWSRWADGVQAFDLGGVDLPLWRHERLAAADPAAPVVLCEGERDAETAERLGFLATTPPSGALVRGKEWAPLYTKALARFDCVIVMEDNDETGRLHAEKCAGALRALVGDLRVVGFPELPEGGDLSDWIAAGHGADDLRERILKTPQWSPPEWPEPIALTEVSGLPDFPTYLLPDWLREHVDAVAAEILTPRAVPAMIDLSVVAAAVARKVAVHVRDNHTEPLNLYTVTVLGPSNLKTPAFKMACAPLELHERVKAAEMRDEIVQARNGQANLRALLQATRKKAGQAKNEKTRLELLAETENLSRQLADLAVPSAPQLIANDVTEESLGELLVQNHGRIAVMSDEGGPFRNMAGRYQSNGAPIFEMFKHGHNAGTVRVNRRNHEPFFVPNAAITAALMVQPSLLRALKDVPEFRGEGLLARFLYAVPDSFEGKRDWERARGVPIHIAETYRERVKALLALPFGSDENGAPAAHAMELAAEARDMVNPFRNAIESRIERGGDLSRIRDWAGKATGEAIRVAALLHLADLAGHPEPWTVPVTAGWMEAGLAIAREFLLPHALGAFTMIGGGPAVDLAEEILAWIRRHHAAKFSKRDLHRHLRSHVGETKEWDAPLALLEANGWIRTVEPAKKKGRPSEQYEAHPKAVEGMIPGTDATPNRGDAWEGPDDV